MEEVFKVKMAEKFAEDERLEQMNANKRRLKEQEHKREIEKLWSEKLTIYREQREEEIEQRRVAEEERTVYNQKVTEYKEQLLAEHAALLSEYNPKAASQYQGSIQGSAYK
jgi:hypothetical protein